MQHIQSNNSREPSTLLQQCTYLDFLNAWQGMFIYFSPGLKGMWLFANQEFWEHVLWHVYET